MSIQANLTSLHVLDELKAALLKFIEESKLALDEADGEIGRVRDWLTRECQNYWVRYIRKKQEEVATCKSALFRKQITPSPNDQKASVVDEKIALARAQAQLEDGEKRLKAAKRWAIELERQYALYRGAVQPFTAAVERDLPNASLRISRMIRALDEYLRTPSPDLHDLLESAAADASGVSMRRTGEDVTDEPAPAADAPPDAGALP